MKDTFIFLNVRQLFFWYHFAGCCSHTPSNVLMAVNDSYDGLLRDFLDISESLVAPDWPRLPTVDWQVMIWEQVDVQ